MRLINTRTLRLHEFVGKPPPYAILSHTWGTDEITIEDFQTQNSRSLTEKHAFRKIEMTCRTAKDHGLDYAWVDTCCINKSSSSELSEAINSMFKWYKQSAFCYAFLEDIQNPTPVLENCRWFSRGWTLQELIAPQNVYFYSQSWQKIAEKSTHATELEFLTGIDKFVLEGGSHYEVTVGRRMSWAAGRCTTRVEDRAYSLLGIFDVNMPLVYGEGSKAFIRLQEQILKRSDDQTLFAWRAKPYNSGARMTVSGLLATSPDDFSNFSNKHEGYSATDNLVRVWDSRAPRDPIRMNNKGMQITARVQDLRAAWAPNDLLILALNCGLGGDTEQVAGIYVQRQTEDRYARVRPDELADIQAEGRHLSLKTLHGLLTLTESDQLQNDIPWITSYQLRRLITEDFYPQQESQLLASLYSHAFYLSRRSLNAKTLFGHYSVRGLQIATKSMVVNSFRLYPAERTPDLILQTRSGFNGAIILNSDESKDTIFILLQSHPLLRSTNGVNGMHSFDIVCLARSQKGEDPKLLSKLVKDNPSGYGPGIQKSVLVSNGKLKVEVMLKDIFVEGLPMTSIVVMGPWPVSLWKSAALRLLKFFPYLVSILIAGSVVVGTTVRYGEGIPIVADFWVG